LWNNKAITIENNTVFWRDWFKREILFVHDVLTADESFLTLEEFQNKFEIKVNYLHYFQLIAGIPSDLKRQAMVSKRPSNESLNTTMVSFFPRSAPVDLTEMRCKNYYKIFNEKCTIEPTGVKNWKIKIPDFFANWKNNFSLNSFINLPRIMN